MFTLLVKLLVILWIKLCHLCRFSINTQPKGESQRLNSLRTLDIDVCFTVHNVIKKQKLDFIVRIYRFKRIQTDYNLQNLQYNFLHYLEQCFVL